MSLRWKRFAHSILATSRRACSCASRRVVPLHTTIITRPPAVTSSPSRRAVVYRTVHLLRTANREALFVVCRIAFRREDYAERRLIAPLRSRRERLALCNITKNIANIAFEQRQNDFGFGVAETGVELDYLHSVARQHQSAVKHARKRTALGDHRTRRRNHNLLEREPLDLLRNERQARIGTHTARIRTLVAVESALVVLRQRHRIEPLAVHEAHERKFGTFEVVLDHHPTLAEAVVEQHVAQCGIGILHRFSNHDAFARSQSVVFQHSRQRTRNDVCARLLVGRERPIARSRDVVFRHKFLGELLARLDTRSRTGMSENPQPRFAERIDDTDRQCRFGTYDGKVDCVFERETLQALDIGILYRDGFRLRRYAGIRRSAIYLPDPRRPRQRIDNRMAATARADNEYFHLIHKAINV